MHSSGKDSYKHKSASREMIGSKAANLSKLKEAGVSVPSFFIVGKPWQAGELLKEVSRELPNTKYFAVRSSATVEDSKEKSYAGYFYSAIGVGIENIAHEISRVRESFGQISGAVIIQEFISSDKAGIVFSNAGNGTAVINANTGLCDPVVKGWECDEYLVNKTGKIIREYIPKTKKAIIFRDGEFIEKTFNGPSLNNKEVEEIFFAAKRIEKIMGEPQDIEWCILRDNLYILQSRPITREVFQRGEKNHFDSANIAESYSGIVLPLTFSFANSLYKSVYKSLLIASGVSSKKLNPYDEIFSNMLGLFYGRMYYNMNNWYKMMAFLPGYRRNKRNLEVMITSNIREDIEKNIEPSLWLKLKYPLLVLSKFLFFSVKLRKYKQRVSRQVEKIRGQELEKLNLSQCKNLYLELEEELLEDAYLPVENDFLIMTCFGILKKAYPEELVREAVRFGNISVDQIKSIQRLARMIKEIPAVWTHIKNVDELGFKKELLLHRNLRKALEEYLAEYGGRFANELKLESEDIDENFKKFAGLIKLYAENNRILEKLKDQTLSGSFIKHTFFNFILGRFKKYAARREELRLLRSNTFGIVRKIFKRIGRILANLGAITDAGDVFYLNMQEILQTSYDRPANFRKNIEQRRKEYKSYATAEPPSHFSTLPGELPETISRIAIDTKTIVGRPCTSGQIEGRVRIFKDFAIPAQIDFDIVVAKHTDPGWTPLIGVAKGLIIEHGGILSHASIVSRELGIPTVIGATSATEILKNGQIVALNGLTGIISIIG